MKLVEEEICCGCGACSEACSLGAIRMIKNEEGFIYPRLNKNKCVNCGKCEKACPIINNDEIQIKQHNICVLQGYFKEENKYSESASGGAATLLSEWIISQGGCVFGSAYYDGFKKAKYIKVGDYERLSLLKGSKYIETEKNGIYKSVLEELKNNRKVLFVGLPCDVAGIKSFLNKDYENLYTCELICHGPMAQIVQEDFLKQLSCKYKSRVSGFNSRYKVEGTSRPYVKVEFENGKNYIKPLWDTDYGYAFAVYSRTSCYNCTFKGDKRVADISVGDSWCAENMVENKGISILYIHTDKGNKLLEKAMDNEKFEFQYLEYDSIKEDNPAIYRSVDRRPERAKFSKLLKKKGLSKASFESRTIKAKGKQILKKVVKSK